MSRREVGNPVIAFIDGISLAIGFYGIYTNIMTVELPEYLAGAGHWQFLTNLSLVYSLVVFGLGFVAHITHNNILFGIKNNIHPIGLALETIVAVIYWPLRLFFMNLLTSAPENFCISLSTDLAIHLMPVVSLLIDYLVFMPKWTIKTSSALGLLVFLTSVYWCLLKSLIDIEKGAKYPYAFLDVESEVERAAIFGVVTLVAFLQFLFLRKVYDFIVKTTEEIDDEIDKGLDKKNI
ncbi:uncharacterized protein SPAPADRAFT_60992 [Spathaspora passalidarum NRRL Y-27907]|uniref:FAR-17a/AIG1-like protein n=1 Tax=Spathaspora passalidarum (strain NRRL Y-27907 / 11-Y1) TaxID=619300 RepID=G3AN55_SPAPN|nr:uncharacterized protein SPAPADRAFT_60992 [Spathaspora passalidarum NRRL Y-27907]EGW31899.1 hypothetical protein SPAPADRAFT_60992 [Spathaspora passalidarum NRRL Y-27907]